MNCWCRNQIQGQLVLRAKYIMIQRTNQSSSLQENQWILTIRCYQINKPFNACVPYICNCLSSVYTTIKVARKSCVQRFRETRRKAEILLDKTLGGYNCSTLSLIQSCELPKNVKSLQATKHALHPDSSNVVSFSNETLQFLRILSTRSPKPIPQRLRSNNE